MRFVCEKCNRKFNRKANLEMHLQFCNGIEKIDKSKKIIDKLPIKNKKIIVECKNSKSGMHELIVLRGMNYIQKKAMDNGYTAYCKICGELI
jgi:rhodanese-related sulfurtransferase